jgi:hypothetical protein
MVGFVAIVDMLGIMIVASLKLVPQIGGHEHK